MLDKQAVKQTHANRNFEPILTHPKPKRTEDNFSIDIPDFDQAEYLKGIGENHRKQFEQNARKSQERQPQQASFQPVSN